MIIDGIPYNVKTYSLRFRLTKRKILLLVALGVAVVATGLGVAHADPSFWITWNPGGNVPHRL